MALSGLAAPGDPERGEPPSCGASGAHGFGQLREHAKNQRLAIEVEGVRLGRGAPHLLHTPRRGGQGAAAPARPASPWWRSSRSPLPRTVRARPPGPPEAARPARASLPASAGQLVQQAQGGGAHLQPLATGQTRARRTLPPAGSGRAGEGGLVQIFHVAAQVISAVSTSASATGAAAAGACASGWWAAPAPARGTPAGTRRAVAVPSSVFSSALAPKAFQVIHRIHDAHPPAAAGGRGAEKGAYLAHQVGRNDGGNLVLAAFRARRSTRRSGWERAATCRNTGWPSGTSKSCCSGRATPPASAKRAIR